MSQVGFDFEATDDDLAPEVKAFLAQREEEKRQENERLKRDFDPATTITIEPPRKGQPNVWHIWCPRCSFDFERTRVAIARSWAQEHNTKNHDNTLTVVDLTR